jgi:hypothetical protein
MSDVVSRDDGTGAHTFRPAVMVLILAVGALAFIAMLLLAAYAPDWRSTQNGGAHALSKAATGFSGIVRLAEATGRNPQIVRSAAQLDSEDLVVLTPETGEAELTEILDQRGPKATLVVFPKWQTVRHPSRAGWVRSLGLVPEYSAERVLAPGIPLDVRRQRSSGRWLTSTGADAPAALRFVAPRVIQTVGGKILRPIIIDASGRSVVAKVGDRALYVLSDPDLLSNQGMADLDQATAALGLLDYLNSTGASSVIFDVTLNGFGRSPSPLRLAFDPPFLAVTLALALAALLAAIQAMFRFGAVRLPERALAFGKTALIDNAAALVRRAGREAALGPRYADTIRDKAAIAFAAPARLREGSLGDYLDNMPRGERFSELAEAASNARHRQDMLAAAQALHQWQRENGA